MFLRLLLEIHHVDYIYGLNVMILKYKLIKQLNHTSYKTKLFGVYELVKLLT